MSASLTLSPALVKRLKGEKKVAIAIPGGLPEYAENVNTQRLAAMQANRAAAFRRAFPTIAAREQYGAERLAYISSVGK